MAAQLKAFFFTPTLNLERFLSGDDPTEDNFRNLFDSVPFKLEADDTATDIQQGLVERALQVEFDTGVDNSGGGFSLYARPSQILAMQVLLQAGIDLNIANIIINADNIVINAGNIGINTTAIGDILSDYVSVDLSNPALSVVVTPSVPGGFAITSFDFHYKIIGKMMAFQYAMVFDMGAQDHIESITIEGFQAMAGTPFQFPVAGNKIQNHHAFLVRSGGGYTTRQILNGVAQIKSGFPVAQLRFEPGHREEFLGLTAESLVDWVLRGSGVANIQ